MTTERNKRKVRSGMVTSDARDKTITVVVERLVRHPVYGRVINKRSKFTVHDPNNEAHIGDRVEVMETRALSKTKRWRLSAIVKRAK